jgi:prepilin-type N-terminal cleavage/methylation domain-containing protein/prepilin-type processing-associated H-X9-DG protein
MRPLFIVKTNHNRCLPPWSGGFSLIELLVVTAIISVLAALLLPSLSNIKERARVIQCMNNLHNLGIAFLLYADEHGHRGPAHPTVSGSSAGTINFLRPYLSSTNALQQIRMCPSDKIKQITPPAQTNSYQINCEQPNGYTGIQISQMDPMMPIFTEPRTTVYYDVSNLNTMKWTDMVGIWGQPSWQFYSSPHGDRGNICYVDGRVRTTTPSFEGSENSLNTTFRPP